MSSRAENWAWERDDVKGITKFVLVYLARRAYYDDGAAAWPSVKTIAFNCGCCERTVIRSLQELERKGYIRPGRSGDVGAQPAHPQADRQGAPFARVGCHHGWRPPRREHRGEAPEPGRAGRSRKQSRSRRGQFVTRRIVTRAEGHGTADKLSRNLGQKVTQ